MKRLSRDDGTTLFEVAVATAVMAVAFAVIGGILVSAMSSSNRLQASSAAVDDGRLISARIDRELRSATCINLPAVGMPGPTLDFFTLADGPSHRVTYVVDGTQLTRQRDGGAVEIVSTQVVAGTNPFTQVATPLRTVNVAVTLRSDNGGTYLLTTTVAGRNAWRACTP